MLAVDAPEIFGMFTDADVKDDGITLTTKVKKTNNKSSSTEGNNM